MSVLTRELEVRLGPDTTMLGFRVGLNSGPVTAGVLRGERSRFQLFGDTVNTVSVWYSTWWCPRIHGSIPSHYPGICQLLTHALACHFRLQEWNQLDRPTVSRYLKQLLIL